MHTSTIRLLAAATLAALLTIGLAPPGPATAETPPHPDHVFVEALYDRVLGRAPSTAETGYWLQQLSAGMARTTVAVRVSGSREGRIALVMTTYRFAFDRVPLAGEWEYWVGRLAAGRSVEAVWADLAVSPEVHRIAGSFSDSPGGHASYLYLLFLNRLVAAEGEPAIPGVEYWTDRIAADPSTRGVHRTAIAFGRAPDSTRMGVGRAVAAACSFDSGVLSRAQRQAVEAELGGGPPRPDPADRRGRGHDLSHRRPPDAALIRPRRLRIGGSPRPGPSSWRGSRVTLLQ